MCSQVNKFLAAQALGSFQGLTCSSPRSEAGDPVTNRLFPRRTRSSLCSLSLSGLGLVYPFNTYLSHVVCNWEEQLSDLCNRYIRRKGHFSIYIRQRGHSWSLSNFGLLQSCFVWFFFFSWKCFTLPTAVRSGPSGVREGCGSGQRGGSCYRVEQWVGCTLWYRKPVPEGRRKIEHTSGFVPSASRMMWRIPKAPLSCPQAVFVWLDCFQLAERGQALSKSCNWSG